MINRFDTETQNFLRKIDELDSRHCKVFMCLAIMKTLLHEVDKQFGSEFHVQDNARLMNLLETEPTKGFCKRDKQHPSGVIYYDLAGGNSTLHKLQPVDHESHYEENVGAIKTNKTIFRHSNDNINSNDEAGKTFIVNSSGPNDVIKQTVDTNESQHSKVDHESHFESGGMNEIYKHGHQHQSNDTNRIGEYDVGGNNQHNKMNESIHHVINRLEGSGEYDVDGGHGLTMKETSLSPSTKGLGEYDIGGSTLDGSTTPETAIRNMQTDHNRKEVVSSDDAKQSISHGIDQYLESHSGGHQHEGKRY